LLKLLGETKTVDEKKIEAYAVVSAMGPTYFWFQIQRLKELAMEFAMDEKEAEDTIELMLLGATRTLFHSGETSEAVMDLVPTKPMGEYEAETAARYNEKLRAIYAKIKPEGN
jgi:pyrroline-5-carboxylate reductase